VGRPVSITVDAAQGHLAQHDWEPASWTREAGVSHPEGATQTLPRPAKESQIPACNRSSTRTICRLDWKIIQIMQTRLWIVDVYPDQQIHERRHDGLKALSVRCGVAMDRARSFLSSPPQHQISFW
jgi:hypothetical protein